LDLVEATLGNDEAALPVIAAVEQQEEFAVLKKAERLFRVIRLLGDAHPERFDWRAKLTQAKTGADMCRRVSPVRANHEVCAHFQSAARSLCAHTDHLLILNQHVDDLGLHEQLEGREPFGVAGEKIEKIPLRHERDEFAARRESREIGNRDGLPVDYAAQLSHLLMRLL